MSDQQPNRKSWTEAERASLRKLFKMAGILFTGIIIAGIVAALLSSVLGTL